MSVISCELSGKHLSIRKIKTQPLDFFTISKVRDVTRVGSNGPPLAKELAKADSKLIIAFT